MSRPIQLEVTDGVMSEIKREFCKKESTNLVKLIEQINVVGEKFENNFEVQKKRYASQMQAEATKQYCDLKMLLLSEPSLHDDEVIQKRMVELKTEIDECTPIHPSPARKKNCSNNLDKNGSTHSTADNEDESSISSIPGMEIPVVLDTRYDEDDENDGGAKEDDENDGAAKEYEEEKSY